jgi:hypothetical protein
MYSYDHDLAAFVSIGTGTVSEDGALITSDDGVGVIKAGWHCGGNPNPVGSAGTCPTCQKCQGTNCVADTAKNGQPAAGEKCKDCKDGAPVPHFTDAQCCATQAFAGGFVVCCNGNKLACAGSGFNGSVLTACVLEHERAHFDHVDCPTDASTGGCPAGTKECDTCRPNFKPTQDPGQGECDASKVEVACLRNMNCAGDATCQTTVDNRIVQIIDYGNTNKAGCFAGG